MVSEAPGNLFYPDERIRLRWVWTSTAAARITAAVKVRATWERQGWDYRGDLGRLALDAKKAAETALELPWRRLGHHEVRVQAADDGGFVRRWDFSFAVVPHPVPPPRPGSFFGFDATGREAPILVRLGVKWVRLGVSPANSPREGEWDISGTEQELELVRQHGLQAYILMAYSPAWGSLADPDVTDWTARVRTGPKAEVWRWFARRLADRLRGRVQHYEFWNEATIGGGWWHSSAEPYRQAMRATWEEVHAADPDARAFTGATTSSTDFLQTVFWGWDADRYCDFYSVHRYLNDVPEAGFLVDTIEAVEGARARGKKVWDTEFGWGAWLEAGLGCGWAELSHLEFTPEAQARYLARSYVLSWAAGMERCFWFDLWRGHGTLGGLGVAANDRADFYPDPAAPAYAALARFLEDCRFEREIFTGSQPYAFFFRHAPTGQCRAVLWTTLGRGELEAAVPEGMRVIAFNLMGNPLPLSPPRAVLPLSDSPVYLAAVCEPEAFLALFRSAEIRGLPEVTAEIRSARGDALAGPPPAIRVRIHRRLPRAVEGTVAIPYAEDAEVAGGVRAFSIPAEGRAVEIEFPVQRWRTRPRPIYPVLGQVVTGRGQALSLRGAVRLHGARKATPRIDGDLSDWKAAGAVPIPLDSSDKVEPVTGQVENWTPDDVSATAYLLWDDQALHVAAQVRDDRFVQPFALSRQYPRGQSWGTRRRPLSYELLHGDCLRLEMGVQPDPELAADARYAPYDYGGRRIPLIDYLYALALTSDGPLVYRFLKPGLRPGWDIPDNPDCGYGPVEGVQAAIRRTDEGRGDILYEVSIPLAELSMLKPAPGRCIHFNLILSDSDDPPDEQGRPQQRWRLNLSKQVGERRLFRAPVAPYWSGIWTMSEELVFVP